MAKERIPVAVCSAVAGVLSGSHATLDALFIAAGAPLPIPELAHTAKWKTWLIQAGNDPSVDNFALLGTLIEEFMDVPPKRSQFRSQKEFEDAMADYQLKRKELVEVLDENGMRYFRGGRLMPSGTSASIPAPSNHGPERAPEPLKPSSISELLTLITQGLPRAMYPLTHRRKGAMALSFQSEYDIQDMLHSLLRPWVADIRAEEFVPSYAGSNTRMDFLLPKYRLVIEVKRARDRAHASRLGDELIIDIEHYRKHPLCDQLWCIIYDPDKWIANPTALRDLNGRRMISDGSVDVHIHVI